MRKVLVFAIVGILLAQVVPSATASRRLLTIKKKSAHGDYAVVTVGGSVDDPVNLYVKVSASPQQQVSVAWNTVCSQGTGAGSRSGQFTAQAPVRRMVRHPYADPDNCILSASAQLQGTGNTITVWLQAKV